MLTAEQVKIALKVKWTRRNGVPAKGAITAHEQKSKGLWVTVAHVDDKGKLTGKSTKVLASQLSKR
jgi:hypothetical protein